MSTLSEVLIADPQVRPDLSTVIHPREARDSGTCPDFPDSGKRGPRRSDWAETFSSRSRQQSRSKPELTAGTGTILPAVLVSRTRRAMNTRVAGLRRATYTVS
jgi:hypothetical protein